METTQTSGKQISVTFKLLFSVFVIILLIMGIQIGLNIYNAIRQSEAETERRLSTLYGDFNDELDTITQGAAALSVSLADRADIRDLFLAKDREGLLKLLTPIFKTIATDYNIRHLYVHEPDGVVFVRVHNPKKFGDDITYRRTAAVALKTRETVPGVEIGPSRLGIRSVSPLFDQDKFIGMVEVGFDYDQTFIDSFKEDHQADYTLWITHKAAVPAGLGPTYDAPKSPSAQLFYYAGTNPTPLPVPTEVYNRVLQTGEPELHFVSADDGEWAVLIAPMRAYGDRIIGIMEISQSRATALTVLWDNLITTLIVASFVALLSLGLMWLPITTVVLRPLGHLTDVARRQLEGDLTARVELFPGDEFGQLGHTLNTLTEKLDDTLKNQDVMIANRTTQLQMALDVARRLSSILSLEELLEEVVNLIHDRFDLYYTHIYLLDESKEHLVVAEGYGEAGADMKARAYSIALTTVQNLVARAARFGEVVQVDDVRAEVGWLPNPLLPDTRSEMAVPIKLGEQMIGVLDVQSNQEVGFDEHTAITMLAVASEIAVAIHNARRFTETTQALVEAQKIQQLYAQSGWQDYKTRHKTSVYQQVQPGAAPIDDDLLAQVKQNVTRGQTVVTNSAQPNGGGTRQTPSTLATPLAVRGQVVGHIRIHDTEQKRQWSSEEIALIESIGEQMSLAIENARLFGDTQQHAAREQLTREITDKMRSAPNVETIIETGLSELSKALGVSRSYVKLNPKFKVSED